MSNLCLVFVKGLSAVSSIKYHLYQVNPNMATISSCLVLKCKDCAFGLFTYYSLKKTIFIPPISLKTFFVVVVVVVVFC